MKQKTQNEIRLLRDSCVECSGEDEESDIIGVECVQGRCISVEFPLRTLVFFGGRGAGQVTPRMHGWMGVCRKMCGNFIHVMLYIYMPRRIYIFQNMPRAVNYVRRGKQKTNQIKFKRASAMI